MKVIAPPAFRLAAARATAVAAGLLASLLAAGPARAQGGTSFVAQVDRNATSLGDPIIYEVTLSVIDGRIQNYRRPDFRGFRVDGEFPSQSTQIQMGGGQSVMRSVYSWRYDLSPSQSGRLTIAPARVRVGGREFSTKPVTISVESGALSPPGGGSASTKRAPPRRPSPSQRRYRHPFDDFFAGGGAPPVVAPPPQDRGAPGETSFIRVVADQPRAYVGQQVVVQWFLYLTDRADKYQSVTEPRTDGFWSEDLAMPGSAAGGLSLSQETFDGRLYLVAPLMRKALFPLSPGKLTVTPMEAEISQVDFFGRPGRVQRIKAEPITVEVAPLPSAGQPPGFDPAAVGQFTLEAKLDRPRVAVGEAVTVKLVVTGAGNLRKLTPPPLPNLEGWRRYEPKLDVKIENNDGISGVKTVEYLLLPQRAGVTTVPAFSLPYFDPAAGKYMLARSVPLRIEVVGDPKVTTAGPAGAASPAVAGIENLLPSEIRPPRAGPRLSRDLGSTFYGSGGFFLALLVPPLALGASVFLDGMRARRGRDSERGRRRKTQALIKHHLRAAEGELQRGNVPAFFVEIDRVLGGVLSARLGHPVAGLSRSELATELQGSGLPAPLAQQIVAELEACDRARFAAGQVAPPEMRAALDRAADLILQIEKIPAGARR